MKTKAGKTFLVFLVVVLVATIAIAAVKKSEPSQTRAHESRGKSMRAEKTAPSEINISSTKITRRGAEKSRYITVRQLTTNPDEDRFPDWSPDGQWIVFAAHGPSHNNFSVWKINVDGTGLTPLALADSSVYQYMCYSMPFWSPMGDKIMCQSYGDTLNSGWWYGLTYIMDTDGSNLELVSPDTTMCRSHATWSPDGSKIVYKRGGSGIDSLVILDLGSGIETNLSAIGNMEVNLSEFPKFSPDGSKIMFKGGNNNDPHASVHIIDVAGTNHVLIDTISNVKHYGWSPDGEKIVYNNDNERNSYLDLWIANADGTGKHPILESNEYCFAYPSWQPAGPGVNGKWIVFAWGWGNDDDKNIWVISTDGRYTAELFADTTVHYIYMSPKWSPQGDKIVFASDPTGYRLYDIYVIDLDTVDNDCDGLDNWEEFACYGTDLDDRDTDDGDENDGSEILYGRDPLDPSDDMWAPPYTDGHDPLPGATGVSQHTNIVVHAKDDGSGVDISTIVMTVEGNTVTPVITGPIWDYTLTYDPAAPFALGQYVHVTVNASDLAVSPHVMPTDAYFFTITTTGLEEGQTGIPTVFDLFQNAPNPTNKATNIRFAIPHSTHFNIKIYDASGRLVRKLLEDSNGPGFYSVNWDLKDNTGKKVARGVYYYKFEAEEYNSTKKIVVE